MMIFKLTIDVVKKFVGNDTLRRNLYLKNIRDYLLAYLIPWVALVAVIMNLVVFILCLVIYLKTKKINHKPVFVFIGCLSFMDIFMCLFHVRPRFLVSTELLDFDVQLDRCKALGVCANFFGFISHYALLALTLDRFIFIKRPLHYPLIMTKTRTWMMFLGVPFLALIHAVLGFFAFQFPTDEICTWPHWFPSWYIALLDTAMFFIQLCVIIYVYSVMLMKFRNIRKKMEELKKDQDDSYSMHIPGFYRNYGIFRKDMQSEVPEVPGFFSDGIQILEMRKLENTRKENPYLEYNMKTKRRSSSVMKRLVILTSHVRAATYVLIILMVYLISHMPFIAFTLFDTFTHSDLENLANLNISYTETFNTTDVKACLNMILLDEDKECFLYTESIDNLRLYMKSFFHSVETSNLSFFFSFPITKLNPVANPILYAFWYPDFRKFAFQILHNLVDLLTVFFVKFMSTK